MQRPARLAFNLPRDGQARRGDLAAVRSTVRRTETPGAFWSSHRIPMTLSMLSPQSEAQFSLLNESDDGKHHFGNGDGNSLRKTHRDPQESCAIRQSCPFRHLESPDQSDPAMTVRTAVGGLMRKRTGWVVNRCDGPQKRQPTGAEAEETRTPTGSASRGCGRETCGGREVRVAVLRCNLMEQIALLNRAKPTGIRSGVN
jgi:hypothetical protein